MQIVLDHLHHWDAATQSATLAADRFTLAKRRWRGVASDGTEFGFDLEHPLSDGDVFFQTGTTYYQIEQRPEPVLEIPLGSAEGAAQLGWKIGNLHFQIAMTAQAILAPDDPAIRQLLEREGIPHRRTEAVFRPLSGGHLHGPQHVY
jgi:urease accessory protein